MRIGISTKAMVVTAALVLVVGARLDIPPVALQDVLAGFDELPRACDGAFIHRVRGHSGILTRCPA